MYFSVYFNEPAYLCKLGYGCLPGYVPSRSCPAQPQGDLLYVSITFFFFISVYKIFMKHIWYFLTLGKNFFPFLGLRLECVTTRRKETDDKRMPWSICHLIECMYVCIYLRHLARGRNVLFLIMFQLIRWIRCQNLPPPLHRHDQRHLPTRRPTPRCPLPWGIGQRSSSHGPRSFSSMRSLSCSSAGAIPGACTTYI